MKKKSYKIIFFTLFFLSSISFFYNSAIAAGIDSPCNYPTDCDSDLICGTGMVCVDPIVNMTSPSSKSGGTGSINYNPQVPFGEEITSDDILSGAGVGKYINNIYKYAVGVVGILAAIVMMWGGVRWITAGGSKEAIADAQKWIVSAASGMVLIMTSYMILNFVNPDLVNFKLITIERIANTSGNGVAGADTGTVDNNKAGDTCTTYNTSKVINFENSPKKTLAASCKKYDTYFNDAASKYNVDVKLLKAVAMSESSCDASQQTTNPDTGTDDCGIMQIQPGTAGYSCTYLKDHADVSIDIAAKILSDHKNLGTTDSVAGYNTGYGDVSISNKKAALANSSDCPGQDAYECCINPGGLKTTQQYVTNVMGYINGQ